MSRASRTGVRGLYKGPDGRYHIDLRWADPKTGEPKRHREKLPVGTSAVAAKARARTVLEGALAGTFDPQRKAPKRLRAALDEYLSWLETERPKSVRDRRFHANAIVAALGDLELDALSPIAVERLKRKLRDGRSSGTINRHLTTLKHFARKAGEWGWVAPGTVALLRAVRLLAEPPGRVRYLSDDEEVKLFEALPEDVRRLALAADLSGMRRSEIATLRWRDVDLSHRVITLTRTKANRVRRIPLHDGLMEILSALEKPADLEGYVFPLGTLPDGARRRMRSEDERRKERVTKAFRAAALEAGIVDLRFHDLRHDFATRVRRAGAGIDAIAALLGHSTIAMATRYTHVGDATLRGAVGGLVPPKKKSDPSNVAPSLPTGDPATEANHART